MLYEYFQSYIMWRGLDSNTRPPDFFTAMSSSLINNVYESGALPAELPRHLNIYIYKIKNYYSFVALVVQWQHGRLWTSKPGFDSRPRPLMSIKYLKRPVFLLPILSFLLNLLLFQANVSLGYL